MTANTFLKEHGLLAYSGDNEGTQIERPASKTSRKLKYPLNAMKVIPSENPYNVILITIDGLDYGHMTEDYTPNLDVFAKTHDSYIKNYLGDNSDATSNFEMMYGIPAEYMKTAMNEKTPPVIISEMLMQDYKISGFITTAVGLCLMLFFLINNAEAMAALMLIIVFIGMWKLFTTYQTQQSMKQYWQQQQWTQQAQQQVTVPPMPQQQEPYQGTVPPMPQDLGSMPASQQVNEPLR